jgi:beta-glucanase (GH16 family)
MDAVMLTASMQEPLAAPARGMSGRWHLVWSDEFRGSRLNTAKWSTGWFGRGLTGPVRSSEAGCYAPSHVTVGQGALRLTATALAHTVNRKTYAYTSGMVTTRGKFSFTYGVVQARIYLPGSGGKVANWPAFWADGVGRWPVTGELDAMEGLRGTAAYHFHSPSGGPGASAPGRFTGWHTYTADWQPGIVTYYFDGRKVGTITSGVTGSPMYLILNYGVDHTFGGRIVAPATMQVDYVRVWQ